jgi:hypothetical protein
LLKKHSNVYQVFLNFQKYVERKFDRKIITMQTDWGGEYEKLHGLFQKLALLIMYPVPMLINKTVLQNASTVILLKLAYLYLPMHLCLLNIGMKPS